MFCGRCGMDVEIEGLCDDCFYVEHGFDRPRATRQGDRVVVGLHSTNVLSTITVGKKWGKETRSRILELTAQGRTIREIALAVGCSSAMVSRVRRAGK